MMDSPCEEVSFSLFLSQSMGITNSNYICDLINFPEVCPSPSKRRHSKRTKRVCLLLFLNDKWYNSKWPKSIKG
jgi:hypothetical protein